MGGLAQGTIVGPRWSRVFFLDEVLSNYDVEKDDFNLHKGIFMKKKGPKFARFQSKKKSKLPDFYDKF
jgi:hypothetical protein